MIRPPPSPPLFPYTPLSLSLHPPHPSFIDSACSEIRSGPREFQCNLGDSRHLGGIAIHHTGVPHLAYRKRRRQDRKSTRLNSSHGYISYAVFCLKKKRTSRI